MGLRLYSWEAVGYMVWGDDGVGCSAGNHDMVCCACTASRANIFTYFGMHSC